MRVPWFADAPPPGVVVAGHEHVARGLIPASSRTEVACSGVVIVSALDESTLRELTKKLRIKSFCVTLP